MLAVSEQIGQFQAQAVTALADLQTALAERHHHISQSWDQLPRWRRLANGLMSTVGLVIVARLSGQATHGLEHLAMLDAAPAATHDLPPPSTAEPHLYELAAHTTPLAAEPAIQPPTIDDDVPLPADIDTAPSPTPLGDYDAKTGDGTVWYQAVEYADKLGYGYLTPPQQRMATGFVLRYDHLTWTRARGLSSDYAPQLPSQRSMVQELQQLGARPTHAADRAPLVPVVPHDEHPPGSAPPASPPIAPPDAGACHNNWFPFFDCQFDNRDVIMGTVLVGTFALGAATSYAIGRDRRPTRQAVIVGDTPSPFTADPTPPPTTADADPLARPSYVVPPRRIRSSPVSRRVVDADSSAPDAGTAGDPSLLALAAAAAAKRWRDRRILRRSKKGS